MGKLTQKVAIITGASSGIGRATAKLFAEEGAKVVIVARTAERLGRVAGEITHQGGTCIAVPADVAVPAQINAVVQRCLERFGRIDILLNNAALLPPPTPLVETEEAEWEQVFAVNTSAVYRTARAVWPTMVAQKKGVIINTASVVAFRGTIGMAAYCSSKAAVVMLTKVLALEGAPAGIRVNCICPGFIDTPMNEWLGAIQPDQEGWLEQMLANIPLHRAGTPAEVARANLFLASPDSTYMTGQSLILDGGVLA
ncbi:MAG: SDR family oxidoreductase [Anaerolineae bacterium]|nr:SDR family oxidoreductase [Anaerolineae bacterium]